MSASSSSNDAVDTIIDLLDGSGTGDWQNANPSVQAVSEVSQSGMENNPDPTLYVWSPVSTSYSEFDAEGSRLVEDRSVEIMVWTLNRVETGQYYNDLVDYLSQYMRDNYSNTNWHKITPSEGNDYRSEKITQKTDHYVATLQVDLNNLRVV